MSFTIIDADQRSVKPVFAVEMEKLARTRPTFRIADGKGGFVTLAQMGNDGDLRVFGSGDKSVAVPCDEVRRLASWLLQEWGK